MAKQPKQKSTTEATPVTAPPAQTSAPTPKVASTPVPPAEKKAFGKPSGENDVLERVYGKDGKPAIPKDVTGAEVKLAPQANVIINAIDAAEGHRITRKDLIGILPKAGLVTRQPPERILSYYIKTLTGSGAIKVTPKNPVPVPVTAATVPTAPAVNEDNEVVEDNEDNE